MQSLIYLSLLIPIYLILEFIPPFFSMKGKCMSCMILRRNYGGLYKDTFEF